MFCHAEALSLMQLVVINISDHLLRIKANGLDRAQGSERVLGCLLGQQNGRVVDISNSFEIRYSMGANGIQIDEAFLVKKQEQCETAFAARVTILLLQLCTTSAQASIACR